MEGVTIDTKYIKIGRRLNARKPNLHIVGLCYLHAYVNTRKAWMYGNQPKTF